MIGKRQFNHSLYIIILALVLTLLPIYKSITYNILGINILTLVIIVLLLVYAFNVITQKKSLVIGIELVALIITITLYIVNGSNQKIGYLISFILIYLYSVNHNKDKKDIYLLGNAILMSILVSTLIVILIQITNINVIRTAGIIDSSIVIPAIIFLLYNPFDLPILQKSYGKYLLLFSIIINLVYGMSRARIALVGIILIIYIYYLVSNKKIKITKRTLINAVALSIVVIITTILIYDSIPILIERLFKTESFFQDEYRRYESNYAIQMFQQNILFGNGFMSVGIPERFTLLYGVTEFGDHNFYTSILFRGGLLLGFTILLLFIKLQFKVFYQKNIRLRYAMISFLTAIYILSVTNAGFYNYLIGSWFLIINVLSLKESNI